MLITVPVGVRDCDVFFTPLFFTRVVQSPLLTEYLPLKVDLTWKVKDMIAYVATEIAVLPSTLKATFVNTPLNHEDFVIAIPTATFTVDYV